MPTTHLNRFLHHLANSPGEAEPSDALLLTRFVRVRDEEAFAALVRRHGSLVLGVCRRVLHHTQDAEDALQATFLILAQRAGAIRKRTSLRCWLHGVALRVAQRLKQTTIRRGAQPLPAELPGAVADDLSWREAQTVIDEELQRLPERYRLPLTLCYLEGKTRDEAAHALGWSLDTLRGRLERGRAQLRLRLAGRGLGLSAALLSTLCSQPLASAALPETLTAAVLKAVFTEPTAIPAQVAGLVAGMSRSLLPLRWAIVAVLLLAAGVTASAYLCSAPAPPNAKRVMEPQEKPPLQQAAPRVAADQPAVLTDLERLIHQSDRIVAATQDPNATLKSFRVFKGPLVGALEGSWAVKPPQGNAPKGQWILFLKAVEEDQGWAHLEAARPVGWFLPYSDELADKIAKYIPLPAEWSEPQKNLRLGLRVRKPCVRADEDVIVEVVVQNVSQQDVPLQQHRYNIYDFWPDLHFEVTAPTGRRWLLAKPMGKITEADMPHPISLKPRQTYIQAVRLNLWPVSQPGKDGISNFATKLFVDPGAYTIRCTWAYPPRTQDAPTKFQAPSVTVELLKEGLATARMEEFRKHWKSFHLRLTIQPQENGKFDPKFELLSLNLHVGNVRFEPPGIGPNGKPISANAKINAEQAVKLLTILGKRGFFERAESHLVPWPDRQGRFADVSVSHTGTNPPTHLWQMVPWDADLPQLLAALREALGESEARRLLDRLRQPVAESLR